MHLAYISFAVAHENLMIDPMDSGLKHVSFFFRVNTTSSSLCIDQPYKANLKPLSCLEKPFSILQLSGNQFELIL